MEKRRKKFVGNLLLVLLNVLLIYLIIKHQLWMLIWIAFAPGFLAINLDKSNNQDNKEAIPLLIIFVFLVNITSLSWFWNYGPIVFYSSNLIMILFGLALIKIIKKLPNDKKTRILSLPIIWTLLVFIFSFSPLGSLWANLSFFSPMMAPLIWIIKGIGITFLIILFNTLLAEYFFKKNKKVLLAIITIIIIIIFCYNYSTQEFKTENEIKVALIQGNIQEGWLWRIRNIESIINDYEKLTLEASKQRPDFIIWPEYSVPSDIILNRTLYDRISNIANNSNSYLIFGTRINHKNITNTLSYESIDTLLVFSPKGELVGRYDSKNPMPFDKRVIRGKKHNSINLIKTSKAALRVGLCFEELRIRSFNGDSDFIVSSVNNQFFDDTSGLKLVSQFSRLIAAENKKYLVRSSNTGITQIVDPYGKVIKKINSHEQNILIENIYI
tara:strand:- start:1833 stop:3155 length:1323 start_codon:yes stop_codon:yes gene_type:complete